MARLPPPHACANCGAAIPKSASACPECGADERTGWRETSVYDGLELPGESGDDSGGFDSSDGATGNNRRVNGIAWYWWSAAVALLLLLGLSVLALV